MATSLTGNNPAGTYNWLLHSGGISLAAGFPIALGDGTETPLFINANGFGPRNGAGRKSIITTLATVDRAVSLADEDGEIHLTTARQVASILAPQTESVAVATTVTGLSVPLATNKRYSVSGMVVLQTTNVANGFRLSVRGGSGVVAAAINLGGGGASVGEGNITSDVLSNNSSPVANRPFYISVGGFLETGNAAGSDLIYQFYTETAGMVLTLLAARLEVRPFNP